MRFGAIFPLLFAAMSSPQVSDLPSNVKTTPATDRVFAEGRPASETNGQRLEARHCAYIVISETSGIDPEMIKQFPQDLLITCRCYGVLAPCDQGRRVTK